MNPNNRKPNSFINYLFPYLMMATAVLAFVWLVFFSNPISSVSIPATNLGNFLQTADIKEITTTERETVTTITGNYISEEGGTIYFTATFETSNTFIKNEVDDALSNRLIDENDPNSAFYYAQIWNTNNAFETTWFDAWGPTIFVVGGSALVFLFIFSRMNSSVNNTNNKALEFNRSRARREDNSKVKFADVAGAEEEKAELVELVEYLKTPAKFTRLGAKLPRGVLLVGPPGTGKTLLAKAVAGEAGVPFFSISGSDFVEMFVGVGAGRVRDMFRQAKRNAPCLIFIDEIDAVGRQRGAGMGGGNDEREQTLNQLLVELDGFADNSGIIVIAATNRDDVLDPALLRAGRFDRQITVNLPDRKGRAAIFAVHSRNKKIDPTVDFDNISKRTVGFSGADIANIMNEAAILAVRNNRDLVTIKDIDEAIDRRIAGPAKSSKGMSEHEREVVAYHEAGHAVIGLNLKFSDKVQKITIVPRGRTGGHVMMTPEEDRFLMTKNQLEARIIGYLGGRTSEEIFFGDVSTGAQNDIEVATRIARMMVTEYGMSSLGPIQYESNSGSVFLGRDYNSTQKNFSTQVAFEIDKEVRKIIDSAHEEARKILTDKKQDVVLIAKTLLEKETITAEEIQGILSSRPATDEIKKPKKKKEDKDA
jgi:cell division protease FtsH